MTIRTITRTLAILALAAALAGCGRSRPVLHIYNWSDYIAPDLIRQFEREFNCRVMLDTFDSNESMFAKLKAGATGYDLIFPSSYIVGIMRDQGMLQPLQHARLPNIRHLDPAYMGIVADPAFTYSVPYMISHAGLAYLKSRCPDFEPTWGVLDRESYRGRMTMLNDMRETIGAGLKFLGFSLNTTNAEEIAAARDVVIRWKRNLAKFENEQYKNGIASGEFLVVHGYNGDICQVMEENDDIAYAPPKEGVSLACDEMVIPVSSDNQELAYEFINFMLRPEVAAANMEWNLAQIPNLPAYDLIDKEIRSNPAIFLTSEVLANCRILEDVGESIALWADANGGYDEATALAVAPKLADAGAAVLEQPLRPNRITGYQKLKKQGALPIILDESLVHSSDLEEFIKLDMLDGVAMKPARCAGLTDACRQIEMALDRGLMFLGSGLTDPDLSLAASLLLYGAYDLQYPAALNGPQFLSGSILKTPFEVVDGTLAVPAGAGLAAPVDENRLEQMRRSL